MNIWWILAGAGAAIAAVFLAWKLRQRSGAGIVGSRAGRNAQVAGAASKMSGRYLWAKLRGLFASEETRRRIIDETHLKSAEEVTKLMGNMKGAFMKFGQMLSFISDDLPPQYRNILKQLQASAPPMGFDLAKGVIESELGRPMKEVFRDVQEEPLAAASIGQVHRARLKDGRDVVVKVQYPGVDAAIRSDLGNLNVLYAMAGMMNPGLDPKPLVAELKDRITEELDYRREARNQQTFIDLYAGHPFIHIPAVHHEVSTGRMIVFEYVQGKNFDWLQSQPAEFRSKVGEVLYRFVFGSILKFHVFNGDPHPGNYLFHPDGRVTFLDFGCIKYFDRELISDWHTLLKLHLDGERDRFRELLLKMKFIAPDAKGSADRLHAYFAYFYEPFLHDRTFTFTSAYNSKSFSMMFDRNHSKFAELLTEFNMPPDFALANRLQWGVYSILGRLEATANFHRIHREYLRNAEPSTELGRASAEFRRMWKESRSIPAGAPIWMEPEGLRWDK